MGKKRCGQMTFPNTEKKAIKVTLLKSHLKAKPLDPLNQTKNTCFLIFIIISLYGRMETVKSKSAEQICSKDIRANNLHLVRRTSPT